MNKKLQSHTAADNKLYQSVYLSVYLLFTDIYSNLWKFNLADF